MASRLAWRRAADSWHTYIQSVTQVPKDTGVFFLEGGTLKWGSPINLAESLSLGPAQFCPCAGPFY